MAVALAFAASVSEHLPRSPSIQEMHGQAETPTSVGWLEPMFVVLKM